MFRGDKEFLQDIAYACERIELYTKGLDYDEFLQNGEKQDAVIRNIEIIGEAVKRLSDGFKDRYLEIEWKKIAGMRDKVIHFYFGVNIEVVWNVVTVEIPRLKTFVNKVLEEI
jgi:uncharacterized protein with HEPN domain